MLNSNIIEINDDQARKAQILSSALSEANARRRATIDMLGIECAINYLNCEQIRIETKRSVFKIPKLFEEFKISDIYYNNYRIDVITLYREKTVKIPKIHADNDVLPNFYFVIQIGSRIKEAKVVGFLDANKVTKAPHDAKYFYPALNTIFDIEKFKSLTRRPLSLKSPTGKHSDCLGLFLKFIDNDLSSVYKKQLIQHLMSCDTCRSNFVDTIEFERIALNVTKYPDLVEKYRPKVKADIALKQQNSINIQSKFDTLEQKNEKIDKKMQMQEKEYRRYEQPKPTETKIQNIQKQISRELENIQKKPKEINIEFQKEFDKDIVKSSKVIEEIFDEDPGFELPSLSSLINIKNKHRLGVIASIFILLIFFALISVKGSSKILEQPDEDKLAEYNSAGQEEYYEEDDYYQPNMHTGQAQLISRKGIDDYIIKQPVTTKPTYSPTITNISWEAPESLVKKANYTKFLQSTGKNIKLNLQNDLLLVSDIPTNKQAKVDIRISSSGDIQSVKLAKTSGSEQIDESIKKVVQDTMAYMKPPSHGIISRSVDVTLVVELY